MIPRLVRLYSRPIALACHTTQPGKNEVGPSLAGIVGSKSASVPEYDFSPAVKDANITWDDANLEKFLTDPPGFIHGTRMFINLPSETDRQNEGERETRLSHRSSYR